MKSERIFSKNATYQRFEVLKTNRNKRHKYNEFFLEGVRNINQAIENNWHICSFIYTNEIPLSKWASDLIRSVKTDINYELTLSLMNDLSGKEDTSELLAIVKMRADDFSQLYLSDNPVLALFDRPSNKGNLGTIIRSCDALGVEALILTGHSVDLYDPDVIISSMGSFFNLPVIRVLENATLNHIMKELKMKFPNFKAVGSTAHKEYPIYCCDMTTPLMIMIGNETDGLNRTYKEMCDVLVTIPMSESSSATSFNVGCAATVMFYEVARQRNTK